jgi:hypothetical protein
MKSLAFAALYASLLAPATPKAAFVLTVQQSGNNVLAAGSGTIDTTDLIGVGELNIRTYITPDTGGILLGGDVAGIYSSIEGPSSFGTVGISFVTSTSGDLIGLNGTRGNLDLAQNYVSGTFLSDSATFANATLDSLGLLAGTYVYTWGSGVGADSFTIDILAPATVPEPNSLALMLAGGTVGLAALWLSRRAVRGPTRTGALEGQRSAPGRAWTVTIPVL